MFALANEFLGLGFLPRYAKLMTAIGVLLVVCTITLFAPTNEEKKERESGKIIKCKDGEKPE